MMRRWFVTPMKPHIFAALVLLGLSGAVPATAQTTPQAREQERLKGVTEVAVRIAPLIESSSECGISDGLPNAVATKALLDNGIRIVPDNGIVPHLYVRITTMYFETVRYCVSSSFISLQQYLFAAPAHSAQPVFGKFTLAEDGGLHYSDSDVHGQRVREDVLEYVERIALDIRIANQ